MLYPHVLGNQLGQLSTTVVDEMRRSSYSTDMIHQNFKLPCIGLCTVGRILTFE